VGTAAVKFGDHTRSIAVMDDAFAHARASVTFDDYGTKQLVLAMTPLKRAPGS